MNTRKKRSGCLSFLLTLLIVLGVGTALILIGGLVQTQKSEKAEAARQEELAMERAEKEAYDESMSQLRADGYVCPETADKAVSVYLSDADNLREEEEQSLGLFSERFLPESLIPASADEVRYIVTVTHEDRAVNTYFGGGTAYKRFFHVQITDLLTGDLLLEESFPGGEPPTTISQGSSGGWGLYPRDEEITEWLPGAIEEGLLLRETEAAEQAYDEAMQILGTDGYVCPETADKAVSVTHTEADEQQIPIYNTEYIPEDLLAETPEEVRWLVQYTCELNVVGWYMIYGDAYQPEMVLEIIDLTDGSTVAENSFLGSEPPASVSSVEEAVGADPDPAQITAWITEVLSE